MADLNEEIKTVELKRWERAFSMLINNYMGQEPTITFMLERAQLLDGEFSFVPSRNICVCFEADASFPLINPLTDEPLGADGTHAQLQVLLYNLFKQKA